MKKYRDVLTDTRGSLPPQLLAGIPRAQIADLTREFVADINAIGVDFHRQLAAHPRLVTILKSPSVIPQVVKTQRGIIVFHQSVITRNNK